MDRFNLKIRKELLDRIKLMARYYNISTTKMISKGDDKHENDTK